MYFFWIISVWDLSSNNKTLYLFREKGMCQNLGMPVDLIPKKMGDPLEGGA